MTNDYPEILFSVSCQERESLVNISLVFDNPANSILKNPALKIVSRELNLDITENRLDDIFSKCQLNYLLKVDLSEQDSALFELSFIFDDEEGSIFCFRGYIFIYKREAKIYSHYGLIFDEFATELFRKNISEDAQTFFDSQNNVFCKFASTLQRKLIITSEGKGKEEKCSIFAKPFIRLGRHSNNDLVIRGPQNPTKYPDWERKNEKISRQHAELRYTKGKFYIFDNNSLNGVSIDHREIAKNKEILLPDCSTITIAGIVDLSFHELKDENNRVSGAVVRFSNIQEKQNEITVVLVSQHEGSEVKTSEGSLLELTCFNLLRKKELDYKNGQLRLLIDGNYCSSTKDNLINLTRNDAGIQLEEVESERYVFERRLSVSRLTVSRKINKAQLITGQETDAEIRITNNSLLPVGVDYAENLPESVELITNAPRWSGEISPSQSIQLNFSFRPLKKGMLSFPKPALSTNPKCFIYGVNELKLTVKDENTLPKLVITLSVPRQLRKGAQERLDINIKNEGRAPAKNIVFQLSGRIDDDPKENIRRIEKLESNSDVTVNMAIIPTIFGSFVRIYVFLQYEDIEGDVFSCEKTDLAMDVVDKNEIVAQPGNNIYNITYRLDGAIIRNSQIGVDFIRCPKCQQQTMKAATCMHCQAPLA